jgi:hypothetical protein
MDGDTFCGREHGDAEIMRGKGQVRLSMFMLGMLARLPGRERLLAKAMAPIQRAANAISLESQGSASSPVR